MTYVSSLGFTAKDIQPKNIRCDMNPNNQNKVRRAWVLHCDADSATRLQSLPQETKFMLYGAIDEEVNEKWLKIMRDHIQASVDAGANFVMDPIGADRLEDEYCVNSDDHLLEAADIIAATIPEFIESLPAAIKKQMAVIESAATEASV